MVRSRTSSASGKYLGILLPRCPIWKLTVYSGKISDIKVTTEGEQKKAEVTFEKQTAMKTALLLNNTQLGANHITVTSASGSDGHDDTPVTKNADRDSDEITQEEKPRARIFAEYLAHGYVVGDAAITSALDLDQKHGVSSRFLSTITSLDSKYHATDRARATDESYGISQRVSNFLTGLNTYFEKATNTPTGKKVVGFYEEGSRQVQDVHAEARRLADLKKEEHGGSAYKASGLEKVFGKEKQPEAAPAGEASTSEKPTEGGPAVATMTPTPAAPTENIPAVNPPSEKYA